MKMMIIMILCKQPLTGVYLFSVRYELKFHVQFLDRLTMMMEVPGSFETTVTNYQSI
jgi:hypothetical protein